MNFAISLKRPKYKDFEIILKPLFISFQNRKGTRRISCFNRNRMHSKPKYQIFKVFIGKARDSFWVELTIFNFIMSLRMT